MESLKKFEFLNSPLMSPEEVNFILLEPSLDEMFSPHQKKGARSEFIDILKKDPTGTLLLPFVQTDRR
jgi:hypothetical protein